MFPRMPMFFPKSVNMPTQIRTVASPKVTIASKPKSTSFTSSMIQRIHTSKPGCGSCGRH